jgi:hypothetical protein
MPNIGAGEVILLLIMLAIFGGFIVLCVMGGIWLYKKLERH